MDDENSREAKLKDGNTSSGRISPSTASNDKHQRDAPEPGPKILFAPDPREKLRHDEITTLPLTRTFSRNSYSAASDEENARVKRVTTGKTIDPQTILPIGRFQGSGIC